MNKGKAVFLDRDGVLNELVYDKGEGRVASPFSARQLVVSPYAPAAVRRIREEMGFKVIVASNQPGVAKGQFTYAELQRMNAKVRKAIEEGGSSLDAEYYCLHHPSAGGAKYRVDCNCRKPKPGLLIRAAEEHDIDLACSYFVGDSLVDVKAGAAAGCKTLLLGHLTAFLSGLMDEERAFPDRVIRSLADAPEAIVKLEAARVRASAKTRSPPV